MKFLLPLLFTITTCFAMETNQASAPATLPASAWKVITFAGQTPLADHPITFEFDPEGSIAGDASCNRFGGACQIEGNKIKVGPLRSTRRACEPDIMQQEHKFLSVLGAIDAWSIESKELVLTGSEGQIRASRQAAAPW